MDLEVVVKIGGGLSSGENLRVLMNTLASLVDEYQILIVPGGGGFADTVRYYYRKYKLSEKISHEMAILAMDQYGLLLHSMTSQSLPVRTISEAKQALTVKRLPILLPSVLLFTVDPSPHSWDVTSDSLSAYIAKMVGARLLVLLKDVNGIFSSDPYRPDSLIETKQVLPILLRSVPVMNLDQYKCVDSYFSKAVKGVPECWILNGAYPERLIQLLKEGQTLGTQIQL